MQLFLNEQWSHDPEQSCREILQSACHMPLLSLETLFEPYGAKVVNVIWRMVYRTRYFQVIACIVAPNGMIARSVLELIHAAYRRNLWQPKSKYILLLH